MSRSLGQDFVLWEGTVGPVDFIDPMLFSSLRDYNSKAILNLL